MCLFGFEAYIHVVEVFEQKDFVGIRFVFGILFSLTRYMGFSKLFSSLGVLAFVIAIIVQSSL